MSIPSPTLPREPEVRMEDADASPRSDDRSSPRTSLRPRGSLLLLGFGSYLPLAVLGFWPVWTHWSSQLNGCNCWDQVLLEWFIHWTPSAVTHGHSVLVTNYLDVPNGINVMWNTSVLALGSLAAPLTQTIGVVHTMAVLLTLSFALSAACMFVLLRRWVLWWPAAWLGGLVYGFSSFALEEAGSGRITYVFAVIPPLLVFAIAKLIDNEWTPLVGGSIIGLLAAVQLFVSEEILSITTLFLALALVALALIYRRRRRPASPRCPSHGCGGRRRLCPLQRLSALRPVSRARSHHGPASVRTRNLRTSVRMRRASSHRDCHSGSTSAGQIASRARSRPRARQRSRSTSAFRSSCSSSAASCCFAGTCSCASLRQWRS